MNTQTISLDLSKRPTVTPVLYLGQGDKNGTTLNVDVFDNGLPYSLVSYSARLAIRMPKGEGYYEKVGTISGNRATFAIDETHAATVAGTTDVAYVEVYSGSTLIASTQRFRVVILENATENTDPTRAYTNGVEEFLNDSETALRTMMNQAEADVDESIVRLNDAINTIGGVTDRAEAAIEAMGDISELAVPAGNADVRGGYKKGSGLKLTDTDVLSLGDIVTDSCDGPIYSVDAEGWSEQVSTTGKNLANAVFEQGGIEVNSGGETISNTRLRSNFVQVTGGQVYTASVNERLSVVICHVYSSNNNQSWVRAIYGTSLSNGTFTVPSEASYVRFVLADRSNIDASITPSMVEWFQLESGSTATEWEPYSGAAPSPSPEYPQTIEVCRGRNLLPYPYTTYVNTTSYGVTRTFYPDGTITLDGTSTLDYNIVLLAVSSSVFGAASNGVDAVSVLGEPGYYMVSTGMPYASLRVNLWRNGSLVNGTPYYGSTGTVILIQSGDKIEVGLMVVNAATYSNLKVKPQIERGTSASPYCPYGHIGLDIYDANNAHVSTVPIPLPSKGWAGGVGEYADALSVDSAGRWEWECETGETVFDGSNDEGWASYNGTNGTGFYCSISDIGNVKYRAIEDTLCNRFIPKYNDAQSYPGDYYIDNTNMPAFIYPSVQDLAGWTSWLSSNHMTLLYPLATPTTEHGYVDLPLDIPEGSTITIPELEDTNVRCFVHGAAELAIHAANWGRRNAEMESRLTLVESTLAELATA